MGSLRVSLVQPQGNINVEEGSNINVEVSVFRDVVEEGEAGIECDPKFVAVNFNEKKKSLPNLRSFNLFWDLIALNKTIQPIRILILVSSGNKFQACTFNLEIH